MGTSEAVKDYSSATWNDYGDYGSQSDGAAADGIVDPTDHEDSYVQRHELNSDD